LVAPAPRITTGDFDGDRVPDELECEYFHMEPLFRASTSGMVYVRSGASGEVLLAHAVPTPLHGCFWLGDLDANGTDDIAIEGKSGMIVYGRTARTR
jgi:hypothetical protein